MAVLTYLSLLQTDVEPGLECSWYVLVRYPKYSVGMDDLAGFCVHLNILVILVCGSATEVANTRCTLCSGIRQRVYAFFSEVRDPVQGSSWGSP